MCEIKGFSSYSILYVHSFSLTMCLKLEKKNILLKKNSFL